MTTLADIGTHAPNQAGTEPVDPAVLPADIAARLSQEQIARLDTMLAARTSAHPVDYRISSSIFGHRFYVAFFAGTEARSWNRLRSEGQIRPISSVLRDGVVTSLIVTSALCVLTAVLVGGMYLLKWSTGINLLLG